MRKFLKLLLKITFYLLVGYLCYKVLMVMGFVPKIENALHNDILNITLNSCILIVAGIILNDYITLYSFKRKVKKELSNLKLSFRFRVTSENICTDSIAEKEIKDSIDNLEIWIKIMESCKYDFIDSVSVEVQNFLVHTKNNLDFYKNMYNKLNKYR